MTKIITAPNATFTPVKAPHRGPGRPTRAEVAARAMSEIQAREKSGVTFVSESPTTTAPRAATREANRTEKEHRNTEARAKLPEGTRIYTVVRHAPQSGQSQVIDTLIVDDNEELVSASDMIAGVLGFSLVEPLKGMRVGGISEDMGPDLVRRLGLHLWGKADAYEQRSI